MEYKAYSFDLDDNLLKLPTLIYLENKDKEQVKLSTLEFEKIRPNLKKLNLKITTESFKDFCEDSQFLIDINKATKAGSWGNLVNCIVHHASIFAIITARGHSPEAIKKGIKLTIEKYIPKSQLKKFSETFSMKYNLQLEDKSREEILDIYLDLCKFYPVNNKNIKEKLKAEDVGELKSLAFEDFQNYITKYVKEKFGEETKVKIGFSDDSIFHLNKMVNNILKKHGLFFYQTNDEGKNNFI
ncbi:hypothetical protein HN903_01855 [archaeon]|jgi:hypothetical protein|nr:hypothetical protein [archaeon]MBT7128477.1 hypothetical protein [archaeon]